MTSNNQQSENPWTPEAYSASASFVPQLTQTLLKYLDPQPTDKVLDIGCGDGIFTGNFLPAVQSVLGIDSSPAMIEAATRDYGGPKAEFRIVDCRFLGQETAIADGTWDKVISNAALHWILRDESTRMSTLRGIYSSVKPGGTYVFEMGGHGCIAEVMTAVFYALVYQGVSPEKVREANPWFFPSDVWMKDALEKVGFQVDKIETEYRPTKLTAGAGGGLAGWVRLMGSQLLGVLPPEKREAAIEQICDVLQTAVTRIEDGSQWLGYVRLRGIAKRV